MVAKIAKKDQETINNGHFSLIPVGLKGCPYENGNKILELLTEWESDHHGKTIISANINVSPSSAGRTVTVDSILIVWK